MGERVGLYVIEGCAVEEISSKLKLEKWVAEIVSKVVISRV